jgi:hypothetical protein
MYRLYFAEIPRINDATKIEEKNNVFPLYIMYICTVAVK